MAQRILDMKNLMMVIILIIVLTRLFLDAQSDGKKDLLCQDMSIRPLIEASKHMVS